MTKRLSVRLVSAVAGAMAIVGAFPITSATAAAADVCTAKRASTGQIQIVTTSPITTLDPSLATASVAPVRQGIPSFAVFDSMVIVDTKDKILVRGPVTSLTANAAATEWTIKLKTGITFGNGDPVNAAAVKASLERYGTAPSQLKTIYDANVASITTPNDTTVVLAMKQAWSRFPEDFLAQDAGKILNVALIKAKGANDFALGKVTGTGIGAYDFVSWTPNESLVIKAKPTWWGPKVCIPEMKFVTLGADDLAYAGIANGQITAGFVSDPALLQQATSAKLKVVPAPSYGPFLFVNQRAGQPGADLRVRQALQLAIDPKVVAQRGYPTVTDKSLVAPNRTLIASSDANFNKNIKVPETSPKKAKELLDTVKAEGKYDGKIELIFQPSVPFPDVAGALQAQLNAVGFNVTLTPAVDLVTRYNTTRNYQLALAAGGPAPGSYSSNLQQFTTTGTNAPGWSNPTFNGLFNELGAATNAAAYTKTLTAITNLFTAEIPVIPLLVSSRGAIVGKALKGVYAGRGGLLILDKAYVSTQK